MRYNVTSSIARREFSASWRCQLPLDSPDGSIELTYIHAHPRSFTQSRIQDWNLILLFRCIGSVANFFVFLIRAPNFRGLLEPLEVQCTNHGLPDFHGQAWIFASC